MFKFISIIFKILQKTVFFELAKLQKRETIYAVSLSDRIQNHLEDLIPENARVKRCQQIPPHVNEEIMPVVVKFFQSST